MRFELYRLSHEKRDKKDLYIFDQISAPSGNEIRF